MGEDEQANAPRSGRRDESIPRKVAHAVAAQVAIAAILARGEELVAIGNELWRRSDETRREGALNARVVGLRAADWAKGRRRLAREDGWKYVLRRQRGVAWTGWPARSRRPASSSASSRTSD
jgi:hypothetical protein